VLGTATVCSTMADFESQSRYVEFVNGSYAAQT
jgi:hypothetical protein